MRMYGVLFDTCRGQFCLTHVEAMPESLHMCRYASTPSGLVKQCNLLNGIAAYAVNEQQYVQTVDECLALPEYVEWLNPPAPPQTEEEIEDTLELPLVDLQSPPPEQAHFSKGQTT